MEYAKRSYRQLFRQEDLVHFTVVVRQTDLDIGVRRERFSAGLARWTEKLVRELRASLEKFIEEDPAFLHSLTPVELKAGAPPLARAMADAAALAGVGPMAAVAGAIAQEVGRALLKHSKDVIVENGGDIYLRSTRQRLVGIFAGQSPLSNRLALEVRPEDTPLGICTSSGTVGPSLSLGTADAVVVVSPSAALADAVATAAGNLVGCEDDLQKAVEFALNIDGVRGAVAVKGERLAALGKIKLVPLAV